MMRALEYVLDLEKDAEFRRVESKAIQNLNSVDVLHAVSLRLLHSVLEAWIPHTRRATKSSPMVTFHWCIEPP